MENRECQICGLPESEVGKVKYDEQYKLWLCYNCLLGLAIEENEEYEMYNNLNEIPKWD